MKTAAIRKDVWRDEGAGYLRKGPFPKEKTSVVLSIEWAVTTAPARHIPGQRQAR